SKRKLIGFSHCPTSAKAASAFRIVQLRPAAARGQITFAFGIVNPCRRRTFAHRGDPRASAFLSRFVSFSFQGTRLLLEFASLQSCAEEPNSPEFTRRHRRKVAALKQLLC
ncbi:hypothetical protein, partial [Geobacillus thermopakistaniensis]|uniref:hypothetical protein n=1 Tax=Geobacillus thermopakistaniensis (strain MAS1) TaxID=1408282 RepID=UPI003D240A3B